MSEVSLFPLKTVLYPGGFLPLRIFETRYLDMVSKCLRRNEYFAVVMIDDNNEMHISNTTQVGTLAKIVDWNQGEDGLLQITSIGFDRVSCNAYRRQSDGLLLADVTIIEESSENIFPDEYKSLQTILERIIGELGDHYSLVEKKFDDPSWVGFRLAEILPISLDKKQELLEIVDPIVRLRTVSKLVNSEKTNSKLN